MKIPYTLVSMAAILRDYADMSNAYINIEHKRLVDIADSLYNVGITPDDFKTEYKKLYDQYGKAYFDKVLDDMYALDGQLTSDAKVQELIDDYSDRFSSITASTRVTAATNYDTKIISKYLKTLFDDEAFGTYKSHSLNSFYGNNPNDPDIYMNRNGLTYNHRNNTIDLIGNTPEEDTPIYKVIPQYSSTKRQGTYAPKMPKLVPIDEWNATHGVTASTRVTATEDNSYNQHLVQVSKEDKQYVLNFLNKSHKTVGMGGVGDSGYYVLEFEPAYGLYLWASDAGLRILDDNDIEYTEVKKSFGASTKVTASINLIDKLGYIKNRNGKFDICLVETPFAEMELATYDPIEDEYDILTKVKDVADAYDQANKLFKTQDEYVINSSTKVSASDNPFYDKLSDKDKRFVKNTEKKMTTEFSPDTFDVYNALLPYIGEYSSNTGWVGACELKKVADDTTVDGYTYKVIWGDGRDVDMFSWRTNDNPRVGGDYTLVIMPAHGMPMFCDSEKDFYRAVRKVFGDGLEKIN